jgi:hypothetical protein
MRWLLCDVRATCFRACATDTGPTYVCARETQACARATHACHARARVTRPCLHDSLCFQCVCRTSTTGTCPNDTHDSALATHTSARAICSRARATRDSHGSLVASRARPHDKHAPARHLARALYCVFRSALRCSLIDGHSSKLLLTIEKACKFRRMMASKCMTLPDQYAPSFRK